jgi:hypothetical protein
MNKLAYRYATENRIKREIKDRNPPLRFVARLEHVSPISVTEGGHGRDEER